MNRKADYSRPEMEVFRFGDRTITTTGSNVDIQKGVHIRVIPSFMTFGSSYPQGGATEGDETEGGFAIGVQTFGQPC